VAIATFCAFGFLADRVASWALALRRAAG
jgi:hypothetical protein